MSLTRPIDASFSRCVSRKRDPLSTEGSRLFGGRFNPPGVPALYLAGSPAVAVAERLRLGETLLQFTRFNPCLLVSIEVALAEALDLTTRRNRGRLEITLDDLRGEWREAHGLSRTQRLGEFVREEGVEGILYPSAIQPDTQCLVVFPENRRAESRVAVVGFEDHWPED